MAKRRRLEMPNISETTDPVSQRNEKPPSSLGPMSAPISKVVSETAELQEREAQEARVKAAAFAKDAEAFQAAEREGRLLQSVPLSSIDAGFLLRDRDVIGVEQIDELKRSIVQSGLRMPLEVVKSGIQNGQESYGLISGLRRLNALRMLAAETLDPKWEHVNVIIHSQSDMSRHYIAMVEENEMREDLTLFERGRIVVIAAKHGVFSSMDEAISALFSQASKSKRSKIRGFALIYEELGESVTYSHKLNEKQGLALASALRDGKGKRIRKALQESEPQSAEEEWSIIERAIRGREPKSKSMISVGRGLDVSWAGRPGNYRLQLQGQAVNEELQVAIMEFLRGRMSKK